MAKKSLLSDPISVKRSRTPVYVVLLLAGIVAVPMISWLSSRFQSPKMDMLTRIARVQGWTIDETRLEERILDDAAANRNPTDADWNRAVQIARTHDINFIETFVVELPHHLKDEKYQSQLREWCQRLMNVPESKDPYASLVGFAGYIATNATDKDVWASKLKGRGGMYVKQVENYISMESKWKAKHDDKKP